MAAVLKTAMGRESHRGFESHTLRSYQRKSAVTCVHALHGGSALDVAGAVACGPERPHAAGYAEYVPKFARGPDEAAGSSLSRSSRLQAARPPVIASRLPF